MKQLVSVLCLLACACAAADVSSTAYVPTSLVAHWDGIDNTLTSGVRSHDPNATVWSDLTGNGNDVALPLTFVDVESDAILSRGNSAGTPKTGLNPVLNSLNGLSNTGTNGNAYTVEVVMRRGEWKNKNNYFNMQVPFTTPRGYAGYRHDLNNGFCVMSPETTTKRHLMNFQPSGVKATDVHTATLVCHPGASQLYLDATSYAINYNDSYTDGWETNFTFFSNYRADIHIHAIRVYSRALAANEVAYNAMVDRVRFLGAEIPLEIKDVPPVVFDGTHPCEPEPTVVNALTGEALVKGTDYEVAYADNDHLGPATLTVTGRGAWVGRTATRSFTVGTGKYHFVDYIASSGTQYLDTGYLPGPNTRMEAEIMFTGAVNRSLGGSSFFGCAEGTEEFSANFGGSPGQETEVFPWLNKAYANGGSPCSFRLKEGIGTLMALDISAASGTVLMGRAARTAQTTQTAHTRYPLVLFGCATATGRVRPFTFYGMRVYHWRIWEGEELVRDFVPCRRAYDGEAGLLDRVSGRFHANAGTGVFSTGEDTSAAYGVFGYTRLAYLQANGTQVIDVDYLPNPTTRLLMDYSLHGTCNRSRGGGANLFGSMEPDGINTFACNFGGNAGQERDIFMWTDKTYAASGNKTWSFGINTLPLRTRLEVLAASGGVTNGTSGWLSAPKTAAHTSRTLAICGAHQADGTYKPHGYYDMRIYGLKLWNGSALVRDLVPCLRTTDMKPGLLDRVSGQFFVNCGTGEFAYKLYDDSPVLPTEYQCLDGLVANGEQSVATGIHANDRTVVSARVVPYNVGVANNSRLFSSRGTVAYDAVGENQLRFELFPTGGKWACSCGDGVTSEAVASSSLTATWNYVLSLDSGRRALYSSGSVLARSSGMCTTTSPGEIVLLSGGVDKPGWKGTMKTVFIFKDDVLVRELTPCQRRADGGTGFYDSVTETFLPATGESPCLPGMGAADGSPLFQGTIGNTRLTTGAHYLNLTNFTVSFWVKDPDVASSTTDYAGIISMGALANTPGFCCFVNNSGSCRDNKYINFQTRSPDNATSSLTFPMADMRPGRWHQIVFTHDFEGGRACLYLDGKLKAAKNDASELVNPAMSRTYNGSYLSIGNRSQDPTFPLNGMIAQVSIWDRAFSEGEVKHLGLAAPVGDEAGLLGYWPLDEGMDGLFDRVANGRVQHSFSFSGANDTTFVVDPIGWLKFGSCIIIR